MCYYVQISYGKEQLEKHFELEYTGEFFENAEEINGFAHPEIPLLLNEPSDTLLSGEWGLIPDWSVNKDIQNKTLNARIETLDKKNSFKNIIQNRCLVPVSAFYEWKWLDSKGNYKEQYRIKIPEQEICCLGGIFNIWEDRVSQRQITTFSIVTTDANEEMAEIHNIKKRMPILLDKVNERRWLESPYIQSFAFPNYNPKIETQLVEGPNQLKLDLF